MATADEQIRVSDRVKRILDRRRREGESYNDVLKRVLGEDDEGDFYDGFGRWSDERAEFYEASGGEAERWVIPVPAYAEALVGEGNLPDGDRRSSGNPDSAAGVARSRRPTGCP
jgi:hypothetical protein